jgi:hypothetical protein
LAVALVAAVVLVGWYARPIAQARVVGVAWRTFRGAHCIRSWPETYCTTDWPPASDADNFTTVQVAPISRSITRISRTRVFYDSAQWRRTMDSVRQAMAVSRHEALSCDTSDTGFPIAQAWAARAQEIRLYAGRLPPTRSRELSWMANIQLVPRDGAGCGRQFVYRFPHPAQFAEAVRAWLADQLGF